MDQKLETSMTLQSLESRMRGDGGDFAVPS